MSEEKEIFWLDKFKGKAEDGYFYRSDLFKFFKKCEEEGFRVVGMVKPKDWNMEFILEKRR